mmetsp:Transcript_1863/g.3486  ORF Transcript_1863/g.3486 Transcript_1863/m.3486 type:complete len:93 (+) Transcript_1863:425-703(+)
MPCHAMHSTSLPEKKEDRIELNRTRLESIVLALHCVAFTICGMYPDRMHGTTMHACHAMLLATQFIHSGFDNYVKSNLLFFLKVLCCACVFA